MATQFVWSVVSTEIKDRVETLDAEQKPLPATGTISKIHWHLEGTNGDKSLSMYGSVPVNITNQVIPDIRPVDLVAAVKTALGQDAINKEQASMEEYFNPTYK